jgi:isopentenyl-diphosphate Delta-isomerase
MRSRHGRAAVDANGDELADIQVELVDDTGTAWGQSDKLRVHQQPGMLHRAVSVVIARPNGDVLLQRRAPSKYHFGGWWANACCSHPFPNEPSAMAAARCTERELGLRVRLEPRGSFVYWALDPRSGRVEYEYDDVFFGCTDAEVRPDPSEISDVLWCPQRALPSVMAHRQPFAPWARTALSIALAPGAEEVELLAEQGVEQ